MTAIDRLAQEIASTSDPLIRASLTAKRATYLAREGEFGLARQVCRDLRNQFAGSSTLTLTCWLCLLEGITLFYEKPDSDAFDRVRRSYHLSRAIPKAEIAVWSTAWLSHLQFNLGHLTESAELCCEALNAAQPKQFSPLSRLALTLADTFSYCGDWGQAAEWYSRARLHALSDGDRVAVSAVLHNIAALRVHTMRLARFCGCVEPSRSEWVELDLESSSNYDSGIGLLSLSSLQPVLRAQLLMLSGRFSDALELFDRVAPSLEEAGLKRYQPLLLADRLFCQTKLGNNDDLELIMRLIDESLGSVTDHDDRAIAFGVISQIHAMIRNTAESERLSALASVEVEKYNAGANALRSHASEFRLYADNWSDLYR